jgi:KDO2-lipid IV(A) lauroyltransferase
LPVETASTLGDWVGRNVASKLPFGDRAIRHVQKSLHTSPEETNRIAKGMWGNLGRLFAEYPHLAEIYTHKTELVGIENLGDLPTSLHKPAIFFSGHLANWEILAPSVRQQGINVDLIYRSPNNPYVKDLLDHCRSMDGTLKTYPKSPRGMRQVMKALKQGRRIGILIDQKYNPGVESTFFGQPAMSSLAFIHLAKKFNCPLIPAQIERLDGANFRVTVHKPLDLSKDDMTLLNEAQNLLEGWITKRPEHWLWLHKRWKKDENENLVRPEGLEPPTKPL